VLIALSAYIMLMAPCAYITFFMRLREMVGATKRSVLNSTLCLNHIVLKALLLNN